MCNGRMHEFKKYLLVKEKKILLTQRGKLYATINMQQNDY